MRDYQIMPHTEIVFSVSELEKTLPFCTEVLDMDIAHQGKAILDDFYNIKTIATKEALLVKSGQPYGNIRLLEFQGAKQILMRPNGHIWDTGGIFDFDLRVVDIKNTMKQLRKYDWRGHSEPVTYTTGEITLNEGFLRGPEDIIVALIERVAPPLPACKTKMGVTSNVFNSAMIVSDFEKSKDFFLNTLGFHNYHEDTLEWPEGPNMLGLPHNMTRKGNLKLLIVKPQKDINISIEIAHMTDLKGANFASRTHPPNLGILSYRFPVVGIEHFYKYIKSQDVTLCAPLLETSFAPYGNVRAFAITTYDGAWMEFYEQG